MKIKTNYFIFLISTYILASCSVYQPQTIDIPLISEKKDLRIDAGISSNVSALVTISYGLIDHLAIQSAASIGSDEKYYLQEAIGYFNKSGNNTVIELYGGVGFGYGEIYHDATPGYLRGHYQLYFTQLNIGKTGNRFAHIDYGTGLKAGLFNSYFTDRNFYHFYSEEGPFPSYHNYSFLFEPIVFMRLGGERLKMNIKLGYCLIDPFSDLEKTLPYSHFSLGIGLNINL